MQEICNELNPGDHEGVNTETCDDGQPVDLSLLDLQKHRE